MKFMIHSLTQFWILDPFDYASAFALSNVDYASAYVKTSARQVGAPRCDLCVKTKDRF